MAQGVCAVLSPSVNKPSGFGDKIIVGSESNHFSAHLANYGAWSSVVDKNVFTYMI